MSHFRASCSIDARPPKSTTLVTVLLPDVRVSFCQILAKRLAAYSNVTVAMLNNLEEVFLDGAHTDSRVWGEFLMRKPMCFTQTANLTAQVGEFGDCLAMHP